MDNRSRQIRIFISSTFQDMHEERDYLVKKVFPQLQLEAAKRDVSIVPLDLRWGITEEESKTGKVLQICLEEIERSKPFFIGLLGDRYGWCPSVEELEKNAILQERWGDWLKQDIQKGLSVTEIEMQYGVLRSSTEINAFFYIKQPEVDDNSIDAIKLKKLKTYIRNQKRFPVSNYDTTESLGIQVKDAFLKILNELYPEPSITPIQQELNLQTSFRHSLIEGYVKDEKLFEIIDTFILNNTSNLLTITGPRGIGKSALLANWIEHFNKTNKNHLMVCYFSTNLCTSEEHIAEWIVTEINKLIDIKDSILEFNSTKQLARILSEINKPLLIILDGLDKLTSFDGKERYAWLPEVKGKIKMIVSASDDSTLYNILSLRNTQTIELQSPNKQTRKCIVDTYLNKYSKRLTLQQIDKIIEAPMLYNPLFMKSMLGQLVDYGIYEEIDNFINKYITTTSEQQFFENIIIDMEKNFSRHLVEKVFSLLGLSYNGLSEPEIFDMLKCSQLEWSQLYAVLSRYTYIAGNNICLGNSPIRETVTSRYLSSNNQIQKIRQQIIAYFTTLSNNRSFNELAWQYYHLKEYESLHKMMTDMHVFNYFYHKDKYELGKYWRQLSDYNSSYSIGDLCEAVSPTDIDVDSQALIYGRIAIFAHIILNDNKTSLDCAKKGILLSEKNAYLESSFLYLMANLACDQGKMEDAIEFCKKALDIREREYGLYSKESAQIVLRLALLYNLSHQYSDAEITYKKVFEILDKMGIAESFERSKALNEMGEMYANMNQIEKAGLLFQEALNMRLKLEGEKSTWTANSYNSIGRMYEEHSMFSQALEMFERALRIRIEIYGEEHPDTLTCMSNITRTLTLLGQYDKANELNSRIINIRKKLLGENHEHFATSLYNQAEIYYQTKQYEEALHLLNRTKETFIEQYGESHENVAKCYLQIGRTLIKLKKYEEALNFVNKSITIHEGICGHYCQDVAAAIYARARVYEGLEDFEKAIDDIKECLSILDQSLDGDPILRGVVLYELGRDYYINHQYEEAYQLTQKALEYRKKLYGSEINDEIIDCIVQLANIEDELGHYNDSIEHAEEALELLRCIGKEDSVNAARCHYRIAYVSNTLGNYSTAIAHSLTCYNIRSTHEMEDPNDTARAAYEVAYSYYKSKDIEAAQKWVRITLELREKMGDSVSKSYCTAQNLYGVILYDMNKNEEALEHYKIVLDWREKNLPALDPDISSILKNTAYVYMHMNSYQKAYKLFCRVVQIQIDNKDKDNHLIYALNNLAECIKKEHIEPEKTTEIISNLISNGIRNKGTANLCNRGALDYFYKNDLDESLKLFLLQIEILRNDLQEESDDTALALMNVGIIWYNKNENEKALEYYRLVLDWRERNLSSCDSEISSILSNMALSYMQMTKYQEAYNLLRRAINIQLENGDENQLIDNLLNNLTDCIKVLHISPEITSGIINQLISNNVRTKGTANLCNRCAFDYYYKKNIDESLNLFSLEINILKESLQEESCDTAFALRTAGLLQRDKGQIKKAIELLNESYSIYKVLLGDNGEDTLLIQKEIQRLSALRK